jgi:putative tricarboxylic transport membrane protein
VRALRSGDFWSGMALAALGAWIVLQARQWVYMGADGPGAGFFPLWYGIAILALAAVLAGSSVLRAAPERAPFDWAPVRRVLFAWGGFAIAIASFGVLGFVLGFALLCFFVVTVLFRQPLNSAGWVAVLATAGFYLVFQVALGVSLPTGLLGF